MFIKRSPFHVSPVILVNIVKVKTREHLLHVRFNRTKRYSMQIPKIRSHTHAHSRESARELPPSDCHMTFPMLHLVGLMITSKLIKTYERELREGIGRHRIPEGV